MTVVEVLLVVAVLAILAGLLIPALMKASPRRGGINCVSNLKQIGLAFRMWSNDDGDKFPWQVTVETNGTMELAESPSVFQHFAAISNELSSPKVLVCNSDTTKSKVSTWAEFNNSHLSYFVGLEANEAFPQTILSGDRNVTTNGKPGWGVVSFAANTTPGFGPDMHKHAGNIGLGDGSAQQITSAGLGKQIQQALLSTNVAALRFSIPKPK